MKKIEPAAYLISESGYKGKYPPFHEPSTFHWVKEVERHWVEIYEELISNSAFKTMNAPQAGGMGGWKGLYLMNFSWQKHGNCKKFPKTMKALKAVPDLTFAAFSILEPGASLQPHWGDTNTIIRCHLGLDIPDSLPVCGLRVGNEEQGWKNGEIIMFSECYLHTAWNNSNKRRIIFSFDTMRPEFVKEKNVICARVLSAETIFFLKNIYPGYAAFLQRFNKLFYWTFALGWFLYLPGQRKFRFLP